MFWLPLKARAKSWLNSSRTSPQASLNSLPEDVSAEVVGKKEYQVQLDIAMQSGAEEIAEKMVEGHEEIHGEVSLTGQPFVMDPVNPLLSCERAQR